MIAPTVAPRQPRLLPPLPRFVAVLLLCCLPLAATAQEAVATDSLRTDSIAPDSVATDSVGTKAEQAGERVFSLIGAAFERMPSLTSRIADSLDIDPDKLSGMSRRKLKRVITNYLGNQISELNNIDSLYITPQLYDYAFMVQNTNTFESFSVTSSGEKNQTLRFAPKPTFRLGGYFGWRWIFLGYTFDLGGMLGNKQASKQKTEMDLSLYSSRVGIDLYYRKTGNDFRCTNLNTLFTHDAPRPAGISDDFNGFNLQTRGLNLYYIFNHHHFSYPAAFSQSTVQRRSCGSFKLGFAFTHHKVSLDHSALDPRLAPFIDPSIYFNDITYNDYGINFGYAYNWVFTRNFLFCASLSPALAYNVTHYDADDDNELKRFGDFDFDRLNFDFILRIGLVYNNTKYFAGMSFILHSFDYKNSSVHLNNSFGSLNFYAGFNFKRKKQK